MTQLPEWAPAGLDVTRPSPARIYDYFPGGAHNVESDRQLADHITRMTPNVAATARANRHFLRRAVTPLVEPGLVYIGQWRPDPADEPDPHPERLAGYAGVGRKG